ncbi:MAG: ABC transporter substrate-binding protein [Parvibaculaceae bacterium]
MRDLAMKGKMSRRDFVQLAVAAGSTLAGAQALFSSAVRAEPRKGGRFRIGVGSGATTDSLDPATWPDTFGALLGSGVLGACLTEVGADGSLQGDAAESFEVSKDARTWVFKLRTGAEFHDGKTFDAADAVASLNHHRGEASKSGAKALLKPVADIKADGKDTVVITLDSGNADFAYILSNYNLTMFPSADGKIDWSKGVGLGPYVLEDFQPGVKAKARRFGNYFGRTWFDEVEVLSIIDVAARSNALVTGEVDYIDRADLKTLDKILTRDNLTKSEVAGYAHYISPMNTTVAPFDDKNVRLAIKYAIDREEIVNKILLGHGSPGADNPLAATVPFAVQVSPVHSFDPDKARFHLKKAGLSSLKVDLSAADAAFPGATDTAVLMSSAAAKAGIEINVVKEPDDAYWDNVWMKKPWCMSYSAGRPTPDLMLTTFYQSGAAWNDTFWSNKKFDGLLVKARAELDSAKRSQLYAELQNILADDGGVIVLMFYNYVNIHDKKLAHGQVATNWDVDGLKLPKRWWFA